MAADFEVSAQSPFTGFDFTALWGRHTMALDEIADRMARIAGALQRANVPYAIVGGQAVALWVATRDPDATRTTKDVDLLIRRQDLGPARAAARSVGLDFFETMNVGMFIEQADPNPRKAVRLVWAGEVMMPNRPLPSPNVEESETLPPGYQVVSLNGLVRMKLMANRDQDRLHLRDLIDVGLVGREHLNGLPSILSERLSALLDESGR